MTVDFWSDSVCLNLGCIKAEQSAKISSEIYGSMNWNYKLLKMRIYQFFPSSFGVRRIIKVYTALEFLLTKIYQTKKAVLYALSFENKLDVHEYAAVLWIAANSLIADLTVGFPLCHCFRKMVMPGLEKLLIFRQNFWNNHSQKLAINFEVVTENLTMVLACSVIT